MSTTLPSISVSDCAVAPLVIFILVIIAVIACAVIEPHLPIPFTSPRKYLLIDHAYPPIIGILILWIAQQTNWTTIWYGIRGEGGVEPYSILILFNALAYVAICVDQTGVFAYFAIKISQKAGTNGYRLFLYLYLFTAGMTVLTNNDVSILTLTPIIYYTCVCIGQDPIPYLLAEYYAANIWSMTLFVGSPTNIIVVQAEDLTFFEYLNWMLLPSIVSGSTIYVMLYWYFKKDIKPVIKPLPLDASVALIDRRGCYFGMANMVLNLFFLIISPELKPINLWEICLFFAVVHFIFNIYNYVYHTHVPPPKINLRDPEVGLTATTDTPNGTTDTANSTNLNSDSGSQPLVNGDLEIPSKDAEKVQSNASDSTTRSSVLRTKSDLDAHDKAVETLASVLNKKLTIWSGISAMPWKIIPFAGGMFIMVNILKDANWLDLLSEGLVNTCGTTGSCVLMMCALSMVLDNFINDQPMTILLTYVLVNPRFYNGVGGRDSTIFRGSMYSIAMGSNLGVCYTLIGALAGLMWVKILRDKGLTMSYLQFLKYGLILLLPSIVLTSLSLWVEFS